MMAKVASEIHAASNIRKPAAMLMNAIEMPARVPSIAARGVYLRIVGPTNAPISTTIPMKKAQTRPVV